MNKKNSINMLEGSLWDKILLFAMPLAASSILQQLFNSADTAVVGRFAGSEALAAVGSTAAIINLLINMFVGLSVGANVVIANRIGKNDPDSASRAVHTSVLLSLLCGLFLAVVGVTFARPMLRAISTPDEILDMAELYLRIYFAGMPFMMLYNFTSAILRSKGDTKRPLIVLTIAGAVNVALNLVFVIVFKMSVAGVAIATVISNMISSLTLTVLLVREEEPFRLNLRKLGLQPDLLRDMAAVGVPAGLQGMMFSFANLIIQASLNGLGSDAIAGSSTGLNFESFCYFLLMSFTQAAISFISQNYGARQMDRCKRIFWICLLEANIASFLWVVVSLTFREQIVSIFTIDPDVAKFALLRVTIVIPFEALNTSLEVLSGALRGYGKSLPPAIVCVFGICVIRLLWIAFVFPHYRTFQALMLIYPISWVVTCAILAVMYAVMVKKIHREVTI